MTKTLVVAILSLTLALPAAASPVSCSTCRQGSTNDRIRITRSLGKGLYEVVMVGLSPYDAVIRLTRSKPTGAGQEFNTCTLLKEAKADVLVDGFPRTIPILVEDSKGCVSW